MEKSGDNRLNGTSRVDSMPAPYLLKQTQQLVFGSTIYAIYTNPDHGRQFRLDSTYGIRQSESEATT